MKPVNDQHESKTVKSFFFSPNFEATETTQSNAKVEMRVPERSSAFLSLQNSSHCPCLLSSETTAKGTGLAESAGKEDPVELDSSPTL